MNQNEVDVAAKPKRKADREHEIKGTRLNIAYLSICFSFLAFGVFLILSFFLDYLTPDSSIISKISETIVWGHLSILTLAIGFVAGSRSD